MNPSDFIEVDNQEMWEDSSSPLSPFLNVKTKSRDMVEDEVKIIRAMNFDDSTAKVVNKVQNVMLLNVLLGYSVIFGAMITSMYFSEQEIV